MQNQARNNQPQATLGGVLFNLLVVVLGIVTVRFAWNLMAAELGWRRISFIPIIATLVIIYTATRVAAASFFDELEARLARAMEDVNRAMEGRFPPLPRIQPPNSPDDTPPTSGQ